MTGSGNFLHLYYCFQHNLRKGELRGDINELWEIHQTLHSLFITVNLPVTRLNFMSFEAFS